MVFQQTLEVSGRTITIETGKIAKQAHGAVTVRCGDTVILATAVGAMEAGEDRGFFPLFVEYRERMYAAGKIPGGFFKREGRPSTKETLNARLIDRSIRPLFPKGFNNEVQVIVNVLSFDPENDPGILGIIGASTALTISQIPFEGPVAGVGIGRLGDQFVVNPSCQQLEESALDLVIAGTKSDILMIEGGAKELSEEVMIGGIGVAQQEITRIIEMQEKLKAECGKEKMKVEAKEPNPEVKEQVLSLAAAKVKEANVIPDKLERQEALSAIGTEVAEALGEEVYEENKAAVRDILEELEKKEVRRVIIEENKRIDGRAMDEIRQVTCEVGVLPRAHGSALFTRGQTQSLGVITLGTKLDEQLMEELESTWNKSYMLHYNFPSFSVGETGPIRGPGRREIGHGALAERALQPVIPVDENFPYTIRIVSDILESNGSSSMASVCSGCLSLMDGGVPIKAPVAGIAMGLIMHEGKATVLTDIAGAEDHCGDMDFKVTGTREGITAFQMDVKTTDITREILQEALGKAKEARLKILAIMGETIAEPRSDISPYAPRIVTIKINPEKIGALIGPGGKMIKSIQEETGATINVENDGTVQIAAVEKTTGDEALARVKAVTEEPEVGKVYDGKVVRLMNFGAFVEILPGQDGMVHISELAEHRVGKVEDVVKIGDPVKVKVIEIDDQGRVNLSIKQVDTPGAKPASRPAPRSGGSRPPRRPDRERRPEKKEGAGDPRKEIEMIDKTLDKYKKK